MKEDLQWNTNFYGRQPLMEDDLWWKETFDRSWFLWKTTFDGRWSLMEDNLWWKMIFDGGQPLMEDDHWWNTPFDEDDLWWNMTFHGRQPLMEDDLWWKITFDGRQSLMEDDLRWKTTFDERRYYRCALDTAAPLRSFFIWFMLFIPLCGDLILKYFGIIYCLSLTRNKTSYMKVIGLGST